jgi:hypothetical protein
MDALNVIMKIYHNALNAHLKVIRIQMDLVHYVQKVALLALLKLTASLVIMDTFLIKIIASKLFLILVLVLLIENVSFVSKVMFFKMVFAFLIIPAL